LVCESPLGKLFKIQVKSISSKTSWICQKSLLDPTDDLFFIFVFVPISTTETAREDVARRRAEYYILGYKQFKQAIREQQEYCKAVGEKRGSPIKEFSPGVNYSVLSRFAKKVDLIDAWQNLPA